MLLAGTSRTKAPVFLLALLLGGLVWAQDAAPDQPTLQKLVGTWEMKTVFQGKELPATMIVSLGDGKLVGRWQSEGLDAELADVEFDGKRLRFTRTMGEGGPVMEFQGKLKLGKISGKYKTPSGQVMACRGFRKM